MKNSRFKKVVGENCMIRLRYSVAIIMMVLGVSSVLFNAAQRSRKLSKVEQTQLQSKAEAAVKYAKDTSAKVIARSLVLERIDMDEITNSISTLEEALIKIEGLAATSSKRIQYEQAIQLLKDLSAQHRRAIRAGVEQADARLKIKTAVEAKKDANRLLDVFKIRLKNLNGLMFWWYRRMIDLTEERDKLRKEVRGA